MGQCFLYGNGGSGRSKNYWISNVYGGANPPTAGVKAYDIFLRTNVALLRGELTTNVQSTPLWTDSDGAFIISLVDGVLPNSVSGACFAKNAKHKNFLISGYPGQAYIYENGGWRKCDGYIWYGNAWIQFSSAWDGTLFYNGNQYADVTGGWVGNGISSTTVGTNLSLIVANTSPYLTTKNAIDLSGYSKLHMIADGNAGQYSYFGISSNVPSNAGPNYIASATFIGGENVLDVSAIGSGHISIGASASFGVTINISKVWLE